MLDQELKNIWLNSAPEEQVKFNFSRLMIDLNNKMKNMDSAIKKRDFRETAAALLGVFAFSYLAWEVPFVISKLACALIILWSFYVIYKLRSVRQSTAHERYDHSFRDQLSRQKQQLKAQAQMLNSVLYWYVLPPFLLNVLFLVGLGDPGAYEWSTFLQDILPFELNEKLSFILVASLFYAFVVWLNRRAVRKELEPVIAEIQQLEQQLKQE